MPPHQPPRTARPAPLACLECRRSHLKCDGRSPICERCRSRGYTCTYTRSGRGRRRGVTSLNPEAQSVASQALPRPLGAVAQPAVSQRLPPSLSTPSQWFPDTTTGLGGEIGASESANGLPETPQSVPSDPLNAQVGRTTSPQSERLSAWADDEHLVNLYYLNFHASHPILLPRSMYWHQSYPRYLKAVVQLVGGHFSQAASRDGLQESAARELKEGDQHTPEMVQARLLYTIVLFAQNSLLEGQRVLDSAIERALELGMHHRDFASKHGNNLTVLEESMRRTWYELYVTDGCVAALQRKSTFKTSTVDADVLLPCEDFIYEDGLCFIPASLDEFHYNIFAEEEKVFSSFCYRIEAVRLLGRVLMIIGTDGVHRDVVQAADNALAAFIHHLPRSKSEAEIVSTFGELDEQMFQAHALVQYSTILLHFPRGDLAPPDPLTQLTQDVPGTSCTKLLCPCNRQHVHSVKAIEASKTISMLAALRSPVQRHSPLLVYPLALAAVVQLSIAAVHAKSLSGCLEQHSDRVKLMFGVLKSLGKHWPAAVFTLRTLKKVASSVFRSPQHGSLDAVRQDGPISSGMDTCDQIWDESEWLHNLDLRVWNELLDPDNAS